MLYMYQNTVLHIAAREGHVAAVKLMLNRGADIVLNKSDASYLHEALENGRKDVVNAVVDHERYVTPAQLSSQIKTVFGSSGGSMKLFIYCR